MRAPKAANSNVVAFPTVARRTYSLDVLTTDADSTMILIEACIPREKLEAILRLLRET